MTPKKILFIVAKITGVPYHLIACSMRIRGAGDARALAAWAIMKNCKNAKQFEIADLLNLSQGSVSRSLDRAKTRLESCRKFRALAARLEAEMEVKA